MKESKPNYIVLYFFIALIGLFVGHLFGPASSLPNALIIDDNYFKTWRNHYLVLGLTASLFVCLFAIKFKGSLLSLVISLFLAGLIVNTYGQSGEPDFLTYYFSSLYEFMLPYFSVCLAVSFIFITIQKQYYENKHE